MTDKILDELARKVCAETAELVCYYDANYPGWRTTVPDTGLGLKWSAVLKALDAYWAKTSRETPPPPAVRGAIGCTADDVQVAHRELVKMLAAQEGLTKTQKDRVREKLAKIRDELEGRARREAAARETPPPPAVHGKVLPLNAMISDAQHELIVAQEQERQERLIKASEKARIERILGKAKNAKRKP